jgi:predicted TIM-barrel fold metal-dependent hydrolase
MTPVAAAILSPSLAVDCLRDDRLQAVEDVPQAVARGPAAEQDERGTIMRIDLENHFASESWLDALKHNAGYPRLEEDDATGRFLLQFAPDSVHPGQSLQPLRDVDAGRIAAMDAAGIDVAVLSLNAPGVEQLDPIVGTRVARESNDALAAAIDRHPDRFLGFAALAPKDVDAAVVELERCVRELGFRGWNTHSNFWDSYLDEKRYWPILAKAEELGVPIYLHPTVSPIDQFRAYGQALSGPSFGYTAETAMLMMRMVLSGAFDAFPRLKIILGHYGEALPFLMDRVDRASMQGHAVAGLKHPVSHYLKSNLWVTTSGNYLPAAFECTRETLGLERMALGTDFPHEDMKACMDFLESLPLSDAARAQLYTGTPEALGFGPR